LLFEDNFVTVEELYFRLSARFRHYLMDEFQDTSLGQWRNLSLMVHEALAGGGSLFYVGDKKQAIYAFRGGESRLFDALQRQLVDFNVQNKSLEKNYRSCPAIVAFNNRVFRLDNLRTFLDRRAQDARDNKRREIDFSPVDFEVITNTFAAARQTPVKETPAGLVRVTYLQGRVKQERLAEVQIELIPLVFELRKRFALKDIAILTRGNEEVEEMTRWFLQEGINVQSERSSDIKNSPLIGELLSLLAFLSSPVDNNAFAQFCLGELMPQATGLSGVVLRDFLFECARRVKQNKELYFYQCFQDAFPQIWQSFLKNF
jgi:ATP-dependent helicase/nuclease subunit A